MFNITGGEVILILLVALIVLGPEKLPDAMRRAGHLYGELRRMSQGFQSELRSALDEPMQEFKNTAAMARAMVDEPVQTVASVADDLKAAARGDAAVEAAADATGTAPATIAEDPLDPDALDPDPLDDELDELLADDDDPDEDDPDGPYDDVDDDEPYDDVVDDDEPYADVVDDDDLDVDDEPDGAPRTRHPGA